MYGTDKLGTQYIFRYGLTCAFYHHFGNVKYQHVSLPTILTREWQVFLKPYTEKHSPSPTLINALKKQYNLFKPADIQRYLKQYFPPTKRHLAAYPHRQAILTPAALYPFVQKHFSKHPIILLIACKSDEALVRTYQLNRNTKLFRLYKAIRRTRIPHKTLYNLYHHIKRQRMMAGEAIFRRASFQAWMFRKSIAAIKRLVVFEELIRREPIGLIIHENTFDHPGNTLAILAKKFAIPFIFIQNHMHSDVSILPAVATAYCVWGNFYKKWLASLGVNCIYKTGWLAFDSLTVEPKKSIKRKLIQDYAIPRSTKLIVWTTQSFPLKVNQQILSWLKEAVKLGRLFILIKKHPSDSTRYRRLPANIRVASAKYDLHNLLQASDVVATVSSTTGIEAAALGKGLIILQPSLPYHYYKNYNAFHAHFKKGRAGYIVRNKNSLQVIFKRLCTSPTTVNNLVNQSQRYLKNCLESGNTALAITAVLQTYLQSSSINQKELQLKVRELVS